MPKSGRLDFGADEQGALCPAYSFGHSSDEFLVATVARFEYQVSYRSNGLVLHNDSTTT